MLPVARLGNKRYFMKAESKTNEMQPVQLYLFIAVKVNEDSTGERKQHYLAPL